MSKATNTVGYQPNWEHIAQLVEEGYIREVVHPEDSSLKLYNYTSKAQYDQHWDRDVLICRGLIARNNVVIARPFPKFFNWQELSSLEQEYESMRRRKMAVLPNWSELHPHLQGPWEVYEKMDGSLGILYEFAPGDYRIATRGSFTSDQAVWATDRLKNHKDFANFEHPKPGCTYLFEIIYPGNRIVVDYQGFTGLVQLGFQNTDTGMPLEIWDDAIPEDLWVDHHGTGESWPEGERENHEGYVLVNAKGFRVKVKHDEYVRLHKIITECSSRTIWQHLKEDRGIDELIDNVPDEFYDWIRKTEADLALQYQDIHCSVRTSLIEMHKHVSNMDDDKEVAAYINSCEHPHKVFALHKYQKSIWKDLKPERTLPFMETQE